MSLEMLEIMYGISYKFFLHHLSVKVKFRQFLKNNNFVNTRLLRPSISNHIGILYRSNTGARDIYKHMSTHRKNTHCMKTKWNNNLNLNIDDKTWQDAFKVCQTTTCKFVPIVCRPILPEFQEHYFIGPTTPEDCKQIEEKFRTRWNDPYALGPLDEKHIAMKIYLF